MIKETENKYIPRVLQRSEGRDKDIVSLIPDMEFAHLPGPKVLGTISNVPQSPKH